VERGCRKHRPACHRKGAARRHTKGADQVKRCRSLCSKNEPERPYARIDRDGCYEAQLRQEQKKCLDGEYGIRGRWREGIWKESEISLAKNRPWDIRYILGSFGQGERLAGVEDSERKGKAKKHCGSYLTDQHSHFKLRCLPTPHPLPPSLLPFSRHWKRQHSPISF
jgi:hypothetical protein